MLTRHQIKNTCCSMETRPSNQNQRRMAKKIKKMKKVTGSVTCISSAPASTRCPLRQISMLDWAQAKSGRMLLLWEGGGSVYDYGIKISPIRVP